MFLVKFLIASDDNISNATTLKDTFTTVIEFAKWCLDNKLVLCEEKMHWVDSSNNKYFVEHSEETPTTISYAEDSKKFIEHLTSFCNGVFAKCNKNVETMGYTHFKIDSVDWDEGSRYFKIMVVEEGQGRISRRIHCFVDKDNGGILKAATYKAPAKGYRGNIFDSSNGLDGVNYYGANYRR